MAPIEAAAVDTEHLKKLAELDGVFRRGLPGVGLYADDVVYLAFFNTAKDNVGIAHIDGKDHITLPFLFFR